MKIILNNLGKRFNKQWIFRGLRLEMLAGKRYVVLGSNGSGKSTLLQIIAGYRVPSEGKVTYKIQDKEIDPDQFFSYISIASPYLTLIEEYTSDELFKFHFSLRKTLDGMNLKDFQAKLRLKQIAGKPIRQFSSGMKQRLRLALAFFTEAPVLLLDEPCSNLDAQGVEWYRNLLETHSKNRLTIICSNHQEMEYQPCDQTIDINSIRQTVIL